MENKTFLQICEEAFECLNPYEKAEFLKTRLGFAAGGDLCDEVKTRICGTYNFDNNDN